MRNALEFFMKRGTSRAATGFSMPELLIVIGLIALLVAILTPALQQARRQAMVAQCGGQLQQIGVGLEQCRTDMKFYPLWDDDGAPIRYTWIDLLIQRQYLSHDRIGYCPDDRRPDALNADRGAFYRIQYPSRSAPGIDYSYGISVPQSAGGWVWRQTFNPPGDTRSHYFANANDHPARRVLATDAYWSAIYNLSGNALASGDWASPTVYDNTVAWRHPLRTSNLLMLDGHIETVRFQLSAEEPVNTNRTFVWHARESLNVGPDSEFEGNYYPSVPPLVNGVADNYPRELLPLYYTSNSLWTRITHK